MSDNEYWDEATDRAYWDYCAQIEAAIREKDNELITRGEARNLAFEIFNHFMYADFLEITPADIDKKVDAISAVPHEMTAREYIITEERCKSWCLSNGGCESCCYHEFCWADAIEPEEYLRFYTLWAKEHPERSEK